MTIALIFTEIELANEIWKNIPTYSGIAEASSLGRVRTLDRLNKKGKSIKGRILNQRFSRCGYLLCNIRTTYDRKTLSVHRLIAIAFLEVIQEKPQVNHIDGNKINNKITNLEWMDVREQQEHALFLGLLWHGEKNKNSKLTTEKVRLILEDPRASIKIAKDYGVSGSLIRMIKRREVWRNLSGVWE